MNNHFYFHQGWRFRFADAFPMDRALEKCRDSRGRLPYDPDYDDGDWEQVTLPHTFNGGDLFSVPIEDGGSGQRRACAFYRNTLEIPAERRGQRVILAFEGVRQTCYVYINGSLAGYDEMGVGPFGFDLTPCLDPSGRNVIAVATDNTSTRNIPFCIAETPNAPGVIPGSYLLSQDEKVPADREGVGFFWNCNDFHPTLGGLSQPVRVYFKKDIHLTLPLYANLQSRGSYVYADQFEPGSGEADIHVEAEVRNLSAGSANCRIRVRVCAIDGKELAAFASEPVSVAAAPAYRMPLSLVPEDAYRWEETTAHYVPEEEDRVAPTEIRSADTQIISCAARVSGLTLWEPAHPCLYRVNITLEADGSETDSQVIETGFRQVGYDKDRGILINGHPIWLRGYAQRAANEWAESGVVPEWMHDMDARLIRGSGANHIRWMHVAASPMDIRACDRQGVICAQPAGDKERETFGRQWDQRVELMRNVIIAYRNHPSILFWEAGNNAISAEHMREMRLLKQALDPCGGRFMGCRTLNTEDALNESEYVGTMLNRHAARFLAEHGPVTETEYSREEAPRRVWDDFSPPDFDYRNRWIGKGGKKQKGLDFYDLTSEELALANARGYSEFFFDRIGGASGKNLYSACAALCWTDSAQHGRQSWSENGRMSGRVDAIRVKKQSYDVFRVMHSAAPAVKLLGHWNYPRPDGQNYRAWKKRFNGSFWEETPEPEFRDPCHKTVYCVGSYAVQKVLLYINGRLAGRCEKPESGFIFAFRKIDVTRNGVIEAVGYGYDGEIACRDRIETAGAPAALCLEAHSGPDGWRADGSDLCYVDVAVTDAQGRVCPLADMRIDFALKGPAVFLGGYNSGRFNGNGRQDSVIGQPHVYAECGTNRVLLRAGRSAGAVHLTAAAPGLPQAEITIRTIACAGEAPAVLYADPGRLPPASEDWAAPIPEADAVKYVPEDENYCKVLVNGQEPDFRGVRAVYRDGAVWGNVLCVLERMKSIAPERMDYGWDRASGVLTLRSGPHSVIARVGGTHMIADGRESLMAGQPFLTREGILVMEINAIAPYVEGASAQFDDRIGALRITL
ncbi:MAG: hypothetical protein IKE24_03920 [Clostridia bacterium]|nr:hypothetical protein [Clostridia bacterium]